MTRERNSGRLGWRIKNALVTLLFFALVVLAFLAWQELPPFDHAAKVPEGSSFSVRFLDVGQGDAALVLCDGEAMLIDGGPAEASQKIYSTLEQQGIKTLKLIVNSHPHEDHAGGLAAALNYAEAETALSPVTEYDGRGFQAFLRYLDEQGVALTVPKPGDTYELGSAEVEILGPVAAPEDPADLNNDCLIVRVTYGKTSFLFTGDMQKEEEQSLLDAGVKLRSTVLKVGHHGSGNASSYPFLREVDPAYAVISVGTGNDYGHPMESVLTRLTEVGASIYRTDLMGDILCESDGKGVSWTVEKEADSAALEAPGDMTRNAVAPLEVPEGTTYILNTRSKVFHEVWCPRAAEISGKNRTYTQEPRETVAEGYRPCGYCEP